MNNTFQEDCNMTSNHAKFHDSYDQLTQNLLTITARWY